MRNDTLAHIIDADNELINAQYIYGGLDYMVACLIDGRESDLIDAIRQALMELATSIHTIKISSSAAYDVERSRMGLKAVA